VHFVRREGEKSKDDEIARACSMHRTDAKCMQHVRNHVVTRRIILKWILKRDGVVVLAWIDFLIRLL